MSDYTGGGRTMEEFNDMVEELRAHLLDYGDEVVLEALILNTIIDPETGKLSDYWMNLLKPELIHFEFDMDYACECGMDSREHSHDTRHAEWIEQVTQNK